MLQRQSRISSYRNIIASGTDLLANNGDLSLLAGGTVALLAGQDTLSSYSRTQIVTNPNFFTKQQRVNTDTSDSLTYQGSTARNREHTGSSIRGQALHLTYANREHMTYANREHTGSGLTFDICQGWIYSVIS